jgi:hypothetical protein
MSSKHPDLPASTRGDLEEALSKLAVTVADYAALLAAGRAAVAAAAASENDPLVYVRSLLAARGQLPPDGASPLVVLADARSALNMAAGSGLSGPARDMAFRMARYHNRCGGPQ